MKTAKTKRKPRTVYVTTERTRQPKPVTLWCIIDAQRDVTACDSRAEALYWRKRWDADPALKEGQPRRVAKFVEVQ